MFRDKKVIVVMPAYNAAQTLRKTYDEVMEQDLVDLAKQEQSDLGIDLVGRPQQVDFARGKHAHVRPVEGEARRRQVV